MSGVDIQSQTDYLCVITIDNRFKRFGLVWFLLFNDTWSQ